MRRNDTHQRGGFGRFAPKVVLEAASPSFKCGHSTNVPVHRPTSGNPCTRGPRREHCAVKQRNRGHAAKGRECHGLGLQGRHAIVSGDSRGIGQAFARELAREGVDVPIVARNKADLEATARELAAKTNRRILSLAADVTSKEQDDRMVAEAAQQLGGLHILVNSGSAPGGSATATGPIDTVVDEISRRTRRAAMPSAAWCTPRRSHSSR